jgi:hypothetical protein
MDWDGLVQYLDQQSLAPLVYSRWQSDAELWAAIPSAVQEQLQQRYSYSAHRNLQIYYQFLKLLRNLKHEDIPVILLKGVFLAYAVYEDRALRPMADVDILVRRRDVESVENALLALGYQLSEWKHRDWCLKNHYHLSYVHPGVHVHIEIHWHIQRPDVPHGKVVVEELWRDAQPLTLAGVEVLALSLEHLFLYQCLHIAKHAFGLGLRHFCDLAAILKRYQGQLDWSQLQAGAERWQITKAVYLSLYFTQEYFGVVEAPMESLKPSSMRPDVLETAREQTLTFGGSATRLSTEFLQLWEGEKDQRKVPRLLRRIFLPLDTMASLYHISPNSWRIYLYYPVRLVDLLVRYSQLMRQFMRRDQTMLAWAEETNKVDTLRKWLVT